MGVVRSLIMDRFDAKYLKDCDSMHFIMPFMFPNRCDNQTYFTFQIDLTNLNEFIKKKKRKMLTIRITSTICSSASLPVF